MTIMRQRGGVQKFELGWATTWFDCCPKTKKELSLQLYYSENNKFLVPFPKISILYKFYFFET